MQVLVPSYGNDLFYELNSPNCLEKAKNKKLAVSHVYFECSYQVTLCNLK